MCLFFFIQFIFLFRISLCYGQPYTDDTTKQTKEIETDNKTYLHNINLDGFIEFL